MISLRNASVRFGTRTALDGFTGEFLPGQVSALAGGDGAGKSTLLRALAGRVPAHSDGSSGIRAATAREFTPPSTRDIGFQPAEGGVWGGLSVDENIEFATNVYRLPRHTARRRADGLLERAGIEGARNRVASRLSGGMRKKLGFIVATLHEPSLVLLDEPTTGVDPAGREELWSLIAAAAAAGATVVFATTYLDEAERAGQVFLLGGGHLLAAGAPEQVMSKVPGSLWEAPVAETSTESSIGHRAADAVRASSRRSASGEAQHSSADTFQWRRAHTRYLWSADAEAAAAPGFAPSTADLENASIALLLDAERHGAEAEASEHDGPLPSHLPLDENGRQHRSTEALPPTGSDAAPLVRVHNVVQRYGSFTALHGVSLGVAPGEVVGLLGGNGAGKTTLIRQILGIEQPVEGSCETFGEPPSPTTRRRVGYVAQGLGLYPSLSAWENLDFVTTVHRVAFSRAARRFARSLGSRPVRELPLGARRTLAYVAATVHEPELMILDEPTSGMDPLARARLWRQFRERSSAGTAILVTTHYMQEAAQCDRLVTLVNGRVS